MAADVLRFAVEQAVLAPSSHNSQPWTFRVDEDAVDLFADPSRKLSAADPDGRELVISCGAALVNLELALAHKGREADVTFLPDPEEPALVARIAPGRTRRPSQCEEALFEAIQHRRTNRQPFYARQLPDAVIAQLEAAAASEGARFVTIAGDDRREALAELLATADVTQFKDKRFRRELAAWFRPNGSRQRDGIPGYALGFGRLASHFAAFAVRWLDLGRSQAAKTRDLVHASPLLAAIVTDGDEPADWVRAGRALERVLLLATAEGAAASFLNQALEVPGLRTEVRRLLGDFGEPQLLLRLGYAPQAGPALRRPLAEVLIP